MWADPVMREKLTEKNRRVAREAAAKGLTRFGIPDGMRKEEAARVNAAAAVRAREIVSKMKDKGIIDETVDPRAEKALTAAIEVLETPVNQQTKLAAARLLLDFLKTKPTAKSEVTVNAAEQWLAAIADDSAEEPEAP